MERRSAPEPWLRRELWFPKACRYPPTAWSWVRLLKCDGMSLPQSASASKRTAITTSGSQRFTRASNLDHERERYAGHPAARKYCLERGGGTCPAGLSGI